MVVLTWSITGHGGEPCCGAIVQVLAGALWAPDIIQLSTSTVKLVSEIMFVGTII